MDLPKHRCLVYWYPGGAEVMQHINVSRALVSPAIVCIRLSRCAHAATTPL